MEAFLLIAVVIIGGVLLIQMAQGRQNKAIQQRAHDDVADAAGVAISTVSRVLNGSAEVSEATRHRVQAAIEALRFQPQRTARSLAQQSTTSIAVALPSATSSLAACRDLT